MRVLIAAALLATVAVVTPVAQESLGDGARETFDQLLDLRQNTATSTTALKAERGKLDGFVTQQAAARWTPCRARSRSPSG
jgi:hypothetical protein